MESSPPNERRSTPTPSGDLEARIAALRPTLTKDQAAFLDRMLAAKADLQKRSKNLRAWADAYEAKHGKDEEE